MIHELGNHFSGTVKTEDGEPFVGLPLPAAQAPASNIKTPVRFTEGRFRHHRQIPGYHTVVQRDPAAHWRFLVWGNYQVLQEHGLQAKETSAVNSFRFASAKVMALAISALTSLLTCTAVRSLMFLS